MLSFLPSFLLQLFGVVQDSIGDVGGLHSKLERKSLVEKTNLGAAARLQSNMHSAMDTLSLNVQEYSEAQLKACTEFSSRIGEWKTYLKNLCIGKPKAPTYFF